MALFGKSRYVFLVARELSRKYTVPLLVGFLVGLVAMVGIRQFSSKIAHALNVRSVRIGIVGDVTPGTLPLNIQERVSGGLTHLAPDGSPQPALASSWEASDSGKTYTFAINTDFHWHNGKPVTAKDINYNIRDVIFTVISPTMLQAKLQEPFAPFLTLVAKPILQSGLGGFGSYRVDTVRLKGDSIQYLRLEPADRKTNTSPGTSRYLARLEYRFYRTEAAAVTAFQLGDVEVLEDLSTGDMFAGWNNATVSAYRRYDRVVALYFNTKESVLQEKSVRQSLGFAVPDLEGLERAYSPIAKTSWAYTDALKKYEYDMVNAKKLLQNAKVGSESATLTITTFAPFLEIAQKIATSWTGLGIPTSVQVVNTIGQFQVLLTAQSIPPDPDQYPLWHSTQTATNLTGYVNVKIDKLLEDGRKELDIGNRKKIYTDFAKRLAEDAPAIFLYYPTTYTITRRK